MEEKIIFEGKHQYRIPVIALVLLGLVLIPVAFSQAKDGTLLEKVLVFLRRCLPLVLVLIGIGLHILSFKKRKLLLLHQGIRWQFPTAPIGKISEVYIPLSAVQDVYRMSDSKVNITANGVNYEIDGLADAAAFAKAVQNQIQALGQELNAAIARKAAMDAAAAVQSAPAVSEPASQPAAAGQEPAAEQPAEN